MFFLCGFVCMCVCVHVCVLRSLWWLGVSHQPTPVVTSPGHTTYTHCTMKRCDTHTHTDGMAKSCLREHRPSGAWAMQLWYVPVCMAPTPPHANSWQASCLGALTQANGYSHASACMRHPHCVRVRVCLYTQASNWVSVFASLGDSISMYTQAPGNLGQDNRLNSSLPTTQQKSQQQAAPETRTRFGGGVSVGSWLSRVLPTTKQQTPAKESTGGSNTGGGSSGDKDSGTNNGPLLWDTLNKTPELNNLVDMMKAKTLVTPAPGESFGTHACTHTQRQCGWI